jgi:hypothetical protein
MPPLFRAAVGLRMSDPHAPRRRRRVQSALVQELRDGLSHEDNVVAGVFANLVRGGFGRRLDFSEGGYFDVLRGFVTRSVSSTDELDFEYLDLVSDIRKANPTLGIGDEDFVFGKIPNTEDARRAVRLYERAAIADVERKLETRRRLIAAGYRGLVLLANNQPQLHFGMEYAARDDAVGPDELRAKITYERGAVNTNSLRAYVEGRSGIENCSLGPDERDRVAKCVTEYLQDPQVAQSLLHGDRIAVTLEYVRRERYQASFGAPALSFQQDAFDSLIASAMYGRYLSMNANGMSSRIDFVAAYEDVSNDPNRQDRGVAAATYSRDISTGVSLQIGLVYATKPEFRAEADRDLTARLGLNFKVDGLPGGFGL